MAPYPASQLMPEAEPGSVILIVKRAGNQQTIADLKQLAEDFQFFGVFQISHNATYTKPYMDQTFCVVNFVGWSKLFVSQNFR